MLNGEKHLRIPLFFLEISVSNSCAIKAPGFWKQQKLTVDEL